jgi:hypothetical protein
MNVEIGTETPIFLFWKCLFQNFGTLSLQCLLANKGMKSLYLLHLVKEILPRERN